MATNLSELMDTSEASTSAIQTASLKRKHDTILVDPDTKEPVADPKKANVILDKTIKRKCLKILVEAFSEIFKEIQKQEKNATATNMSLSHSITSIIFTCHNYHRQKVTAPASNLISKVKLTTFQVTILGKTVSLPRDEVFKIWTTIVTKYELVYKKFEPNDKTNWLGTMGPYLNFFSSWGLRVNELRTGHQRMPIGKNGDGAVLDCHMSKYGLMGAHAVLLEGNTYPPERRASMAQSMGPMTAFMSMLKSEGDYRKKWENAVKKAMSHIGPIDDIIAITKNIKDSSQLSPLISVLADILLVTTSRQTQRISFPLNAFAKVYTELDVTLKDRFLDVFNVSGRPAFMTYSSISAHQWEMEADHTQEAASQVAFHGIFGTYKEDLSLLEQITSEKNWWTREQLGAGFKKTSKTIRKFKLPTLLYYSKMSSANQTGLLSGVHTQVSSIPCFSGKTTRPITDEFFQHLQRRTISQTGGKSIQQIISSLNTLLGSLQEEIRDRKGSLNMGTKNWCSMTDANMAHDGSEMDFPFVVTGKFFMGKKL